MQSVKQLFPIAMCSISDDACVVFIAKHRSAA